MALNQLSSVTQPTEYSKQIKYSNKSYGELKKNLIDFIKFYYPDDYQDFSDASPGSIFIDMAAYLGDVLSYYTDYSFKENLLAYAEERENVISIAQGFGFKPRTTSPAVCTATISMLAPADADGNLDTKYLLVVNVGSTFTSATNGAISFVSTEVADFSNPLNRTVIPYSVDNLTGLPTSYVVSKQIKLQSATEKIINYQVATPTKFLKVQLPDTNVIDIKSVIDTEGNVWYQVDNLTQDYVFQDILASPGLASAPLYKIKPIKTTRRFITRLNRQLRTELVFGAGTGVLNEIYESPDYKSVYDSNYLQNLTNVPLDTLNFTDSDSFGLAPGNTTLTITYRTGGGVASNVASQTINKVNNLLVLNETRTFTSAEQSVFNIAKSSVSIINDEPATGGGDPPTVDQIRQAAIGFINAQSRIVTTSDYENRVLSMPAKYGTVAKAFVVRDDHINTITRLSRESQVTGTTLDPEDDVLYVNDNPINTNINLYVLGYDQNKRLQILNNTVKTNIKKFLSGYRVLTDRINIVDAFPVNIGIDYSIVVYKGFNTYDVLTRVSDRLVKFFDIDKWQINQPVILADIFLEIAKVEGVQSVTKLEIVNKYQQKDGSDYAPYAYNIEQNTIDGIIYPSADPCIFEIRYPQDDIRGTAIQ